MKLSDTKTVIKEIEDQMCYFETIEEYEIVETLRAELEQLELELLLEESTRTYH